MYIQSYSPSCDLQSPKIERPSLSYSFLDADEDCRLKTKQQQKVPTEENPMKMF
jgi:hypothetical protein